MIRGGLLAVFFLVPLAIASAMTPVEVVDAFAKMYSSISDYQCRMHEFCYQGGRYEERIMDLYFKRPRLIRLDIRKGNRLADTGSVGVYLGDGKVTGRKGGILGLIAITVDKHDPQATTIRGRTFDQSDLEGALQIMRGLLPLGSSDLTTGPGGYELSFVPRDPGYGGGITREVIRLDASTLLPTSTDSYMGDRVVQHAQWDHYTLNAGIPAALFDVGWDPAQLGARGIASVHEVPVQ